MAQITSRQRDYTDLDLNFTANPVTKDIAVKVGPDAIARSVRNLVLTNFYDRPFRSYIGSNAQKLLFDNMDSSTARLLEQTIQQTIENFEPRVSVVGIKVLADPDNNRYLAKIAFAIDNRPEPFQTTLFLERIR
jgi:phage baseplate assembly protein W